MEFYESGHLDCLFDCGLTFSSLETLHLHVELEHREDNGISPFLARPDSPPAPSSSRHRGTPPLPTRHPPRVPVYNEHYEGSHEPEVEPYTLCPEPYCGEQILLIELNEHLDLHEAERLINEGSITESDSYRDQALTSYSSSPILQDSSEPSPSHIEKFSTDISPALKPKIEKREESEASPRVGMRRKFLSMIGMEKKQSNQSDASKSPVPRLSVST